MVIGRSISADAECGILRDLQVGGQSLTVFCRVPLAVFRSPASDRRDTIEATSDCRVGCVRDSSLIAEG